MRRYLGQIQVSSVPPIGLNKTKRTARSRPYFVPLRADALGVRVGALLQREDGTGNVTACAKARWHWRENARPRGVTRRAGLAQNVVRLRIVAYVVAIVM